MDSLSLAAEGSARRGDEERRHPWLVFRCADLALGVPALRIDELTEMSEVTPLPRLPDHVPGVVLFRGTAVPVLDVGRFLGAEDAPGTESPHPPRLLMTRLDDMTVALLADRVIGLRLLLEDDFEPSEALPNRIRDCCPRQTRLEEELVALLDLETLILAAKPGKPG